MLKDIHGAMSKTAKVLSDAHANIRNSILFDAVEKNGTGYWTSFIDLSKAALDIRQIEKKLRQLDVVQGIKIAKPKPLNYDVIHFPIIHSESIAAVMPAELFGSLLDEIEKILSPSGFAAVFYNAGKRSGAFITELVEKRFRLKGEPLKLALAQATQAIGWGQIEHFDVNRQKFSAKIRMRMCFEALLRGRKQEKVCHWTRGFIAGFLSEVFQKPIDATELKCAAAGDRICEFEAKPKT
jgi:predicted hydrocarbon binding protein